MALIALLETGLSGARPFRAEPISEGALNMPIKHHFSSISDAVMILCRSYMESGFFKTLRKCDLSGEATTSLF